MTFNADGNLTGYVDYANNYILDSTHSFTTGDEVLYTVPAGQVAIDGLTSGTNYFVGNVVGSRFELSATSGGAPITLTAPHEITFDADDDTIKDIVNNKIVVANTFSNGDKFCIKKCAGYDIGGLTRGNYFIVNASATGFNFLQFLAVRQ